MSTKLFSLLLAGTLTLSIATPAAAELRRHSGEQPRKTQTHQGRQDGSSIQRAVVIKENDTRRGIDAENAWIAKNLPGHQKIGKRSFRAKAAKASTTASTCRLPMAAGTAFISKSAASSAKSTASL